MTISMLISNLTLPASDSLQPHPERLARAGIRHSRDGKLETLPRRKKRLQGSVTAPIR